ncbi:MAG: alpha/beta fold hydrolase [Synechococcales cyanobacterium M58_A2018_015]|nr:alpha/beta fold hydrolase [Synechococcales cyanobacterium M58_A2018_015]
MNYIYLHGFASSPESTKARYLSQQFQALQMSLLTPDLNQGDFYHLTLTRQIHQVKALLPAQPLSVTLIGSSLGGLTAAWLAESCEQIARLVLLAPAFGFLAHWLPRLSETQKQQWQSDGAIDIYHYGAKRPLPLSYGFITDLAQYDETQLQRPIPTLILHGRQDDVIPVQASRSYAAQRSWVQLVELDADHTLGTVQPQIWQHIVQFCKLESALA